MNGFNGLGLHTLFSIIRLFGGTFKNFVFIQVGTVDAGNFKGVEEVARMKTEVKKELDRYVHYMRCHGYYAAAYSSFGTDVVDEIARRHAGDPGAISERDPVRRTARISEDHIPIRRIPQLYDLRRPAKILQRGHSRRDPPDPCLTDIDADRLCGMNIPLTALSRLFPIDPLLPVRLQFKHDVSSQV